MEWAFFTRTQRGEYDTALFELERCWGKPPGSPIPHAATQRPPVERTVRSVEDVHQAMAHFIGQLAAAPVVSFATHVSGDVAFRPVSDAEMAAALGRRNVAGPAERDIYVSYVHEAFLNALEPYAGRIAFQFSLGAEPLPHETSSLIPQRALADTGRHDRAASEDPLRLPVVEPPREPVALHVLPRAAQFLRWPATGGTTSSPAPCGR